MIPFLCPRCRTRHDLDDSTAGTEFQCQCGQPILVPTVDNSPLPGLPIEPEDEWEYEHEEPQRVNFSLGGPSLEMFWLMTLLAGIPIVFVLLLLVSFGK